MLRRFAGSCIVLLACGTGAPSTAPSSHPASVRPAATPAPSMPPSEFTIHVGETVTLADGATLRFAGNTDVMMNSPPCDLL